MDKSLEVKLLRGKEMCDVADEVLRVAHASEYCNKLTGVIKEWRDLEGLDTADYYLVLNAGNQLYRIFGDKYEDEAVPEDIRRRLALAMSRWFECLTDEEVKEFQQDMTHLPGAMQL